MQSQEKHLHRVDVSVQTGPRTIPEPAPGFLFKISPTFTSMLLEILTQETNAPFTNVYIKFARNYSGQLFSDKQTKTI